MDRAKVKDRKEMLKLLEAWSSKVNLINESMLFQIE